MKKCVIILLITGLQFSCSSPEKKDPTDPGKLAKASSIPPPPEEPCENISIANLPVITHGFLEKKYQYVTVQTFKKNSKFDSLIHEYKVELEKVFDEERQKWDFSLPESATTGLDLKLIFGKNLVYEITEMKTGWVPRWCSVLSPGIIICDIVTGN